MSSVWWLAGLNVELWFIVIIISYVIIDIHKYSFVIPLSSFFLLCSPCLALMYGGCRWFGGRTGAICSTYTVQYKNM